MQTYTTKVFPEKVAFLGAPKKSIVAIGTYGCIGGKENKYHFEAGIFHDGHYDKNPTAQKLTDMINGNYIGDKRTNLDLPYVITTSGDIIVGRRNGNGKDGLATPHPTLIGGKNPEVAMAGMLHIHGGKIASYDTNSGHFKPNIKSMPIADEAFKKLSPNLFKKKRGK